MCVCLRITLQFRRARTHQSWNVIGEELFFRSGRATRSRLLEQLNKTASPRILNAQMVQKSRVYAGSATVTGSKIKWELRQACRGHTMAKQDVDARKNA